MLRWCPVHRTLLVLWLLVVYPSLFKCELSKKGDAKLEEVTVTDDEGDGLEEQPDIFVPTKEWKVIMEGQHIPPGLHVRMDLQSGLKEAKLLDSEEGNELEEGRNESEIDDESEAVSGGDKARPYGVSDRRGVINKRTKVFSTKEVANMLKEPKDESSDVSNLPRLTWSHPSPSQDSSAAPSPSEAGEKRRGQGTKPAPHVHSMLPLTRHRDVEEMLALAAVLANKSSSVEGLCRAMEELEYFVHQINNANDLNVIGGLVLVVRLLNHTHPDVRGWAAHVIGSASQR